MDTPSPIDLSRVVVIGTSSSGKTTFARELARRLAADHTDLDSLCWLPNWQLRTDEDFRARATAWATREQWVIDGNYTRVRDILWTRATAVIWLDYPFLLVLWRSLKRTIKRSVTGEEICNGNRESWAKSFFSRDSILLWVIQTHGKNRKRYAATFADWAYPNATKIRLSTPAATAAFMDQITPI